MALIPISPVTSTVVTPVISVSLPYNVQGVGISYNQFLQSLGKYNYGVEYIYMSASTYPQISQPIYYNNKDANGNEVATFLPFTTDPYQSQPSIFFKTDEEQIVLSLLSSMSFLLLKNSTVFLKYYTKIAYVGNELDDRGNPSGDNAFEELEQTEGINFFKDFCNYIIDND